MALNVNADHVSPDCLILCPVQFNSPARLHFFLFVTIRGHRFDEPEDEKTSLRQCQPLMERLVTTLGGPLCSTLMVADSLEIIAHACRALSKLSDTNTTIQV